ncbi:fumarate/nitrate reduction transcriptional regulator Fnr [Halopseudomonas salegens]|uniref:CRP/FNR family transcriptional regulator, anaerobic regulatory protein n=1 Tax=Halopseudomonas salegens TaxID=1434072 RepID=A0A1H2F6T6_9GAMM|nr:fumarate/nitrate reduction transcriptional regulator Fnr [Halopseudomonas salegens]SDU03037.1 CRP/FNR family transcriptional regulator, anaerobic regulatory protein [Halopseudomonas salegens]
MSTTIPLRRVAEPHCNECSLVSLCLPTELTDNELIQVDQIITHGRTLQPGDVLFRQGEPALSVFALRSGSLKSVAVTEKGQEQITAFYLPGEMVGLSASEGEEYPVTTTALDTSAVCEVSFARLDNLSSHLPTLRRHFLKLMSREIRDSQQMMLLLSKKTAEQRLATFLLDLSARHRTRGYSATSFRLAMSRHDIADYLGLAVETVSRVLTRFSQADLLVVDGKQIDFNIAPGDFYARVEELF